MPPEPDNRFAAAAAVCVDFCQRRPWLVVALSVILLAASAVYLAGHFRIDTDTEDMLSADLPFRKNAIAIDAAFPALEDRLLIAVEAASADAADDGVRRLAAALRGMPEVFSDLLAPEAEPFFDRHGLLYLSPDELADVSARLTAAQPFLGLLWRQPNLGGLADLLELLGKSDDGTAAARVLGEMATVAETARAGLPARLGWSSLLFGTGLSQDGRQFRLIAARPVLDYGSLQPAARAMAAVRAAAEDVGLTRDGIRVRMTGPVALESDELRSVESGMRAAGLISVALVTVILFAGLRAPGAMAALLATLVAGLVWTATFAIAALGALNLISVAFAVLFVGLSVDFGIHVFLRATEHAGHTAWSEALVKGGKGVAASLGLCTLTSVIAFFSFLPTSYVGLAELGLIAGVGMVIALLTNLTLLPALLRLCVRHPPAFQQRHPLLRHAAGGLQRHGRPIVWAAVAVTLGAGYLAKDVRFDFDPMNLRDPGAPSMQTLFDLADAGVLHPYKAEVLTPDVAAARTLAEALRALPEVGAVSNIDSLIPAAQDEKLAAIDNLALLLGPSFFSPLGSVEMQPDAVDGALQGIRGALQDLSDNDGLSAPAARLARALAPPLDGEAAAAVNQALFLGLVPQLERLNTLLSAEPVTIDTLPPHLRRLYVSDDGRARIEIAPKGDDRTLDDLAAFAAAVTAVAPNASGAPVIIVEAGRAVIAAFAEALLLSVILIALVLAILLRRAVDVALVFAPVAMAAVWTLAVAAMFDISLNFANVIVLPLLFGLCVDFGVHLVLRRREAAGTAEALATTTPRAVLLSALTTIGSFGSIMLSGHPGTASMGMLLTISVSLSLLAILVVLPALMAMLTPSEAEG